MRSIVRSVANRPALLAAVGLLAAGCATVPPEEDPVYQKLSELDGRLLRIERVLSNQSLLDLVQDIDAAKAEARTLRGQIEELQFELDTRREQQREMYADLDSRLVRIEQGGAGAAATAGAAAGAASGSALPVPQGGDRANYQAAFDLLKAGQYEAAAAAFRQFLETFPQSSLADNAQYWLGESNYVTKNYQQALKDFDKVVEQYPQSRKLPDALLKIGYCNYELGNNAKAREALTRVQQQFPDTTAARLAGQRLAQMSSEGR
jgi:tol-pal system protein YbgF